MKQFTVVMQNDKTPSFTNFATPEKALEFIITQANDKFKVHNIFSCDKDGKTAFLSPTLVDGRLQLVEGF